MPPSEDEEYIVGSDDKGFLLEDLEMFDIQSQIANRGCDYYNHKKVVYLCLEKANNHLIFNRWLFGMLKRILGKGIRFFIVL